MYIIALTGGIACGKTTVSQMLAERGAAVIDADQISRGLTAPGGRALPAVRETFGDGVFLEDGTLDRARLAKVVFADREAIERLNAIIHPLVQQEMDAQLELCRKNGEQVVVLDVPLLFEAGMQHMGDIVACVTAPQEIQIMRMHSRNGYTREEAMSRIRSQMAVDEKAKRSDVVIDTNCTLDELRTNVEMLYQEWLDAARKENT